METEKAKIVEELPKEKHYFAIVRDKHYGNWFAVSNSSLDPRDGQAVKRDTERNWAGYDIKLLEVEL